MFLREATAQRVVHPLRRVVQPGTCLRAVLCRLAASRSWAASRCSWQVQLAAPDAIVTIAGAWCCHKGRVLTKPDTQGRERRAHSACIRHLRGWACDLTLVDRVRGTRWCALLCPYLELSAQVTMPQQHDSNLPLSACDQHLLGWRDILLRQTAGANQTTGCMVI
jgi:hypothetical protein